MALPLGNNRSVEKSPMQPRVEHRVLAGIGVAMLLWIAYGALLLAGMLLPRLLAGTAPSTGQLAVFFLIGAVAGYLAEQIVRGMRPLGYAGSILAGMLGAWIASNLLSRPPRWDYPISTSAGNVPTLTAFGLALLSALGWRFASGSEAFRRVGNVFGRLFPAGAPWQSGFQCGWFAGFLVGCTVGWGVGLVVSLARRPHGVGPASLLLVSGLVLAGLFGWRALFVRSGWRFFRHPFDRWWAYAATGFLTGAAGLLLLAACMRGIA